MTRRLGRIPIGILDSMTATTLKVDTDVRDRLAAIARSQHVTLGELLDKVSRRLAYEQMMADAADVMRRMQREDPEAWNGYLAELRLWDDATSSDGLGNAAEEWPDYNTPEYRASIGTRA
jgi:hypothetical protein